MLGFGKQAESLQVSVVLRCYVHGRIEALGKPGSGKFRRVWGFFRTFVEQGRIQWHLLLQLMRLIGLSVDSRDSSENEWAGSAEQ